jgi:hypothetical protein
MPRRRVAALDGPAQRAFAGISGVADTENFGLKWRRRLRLRKGRQTQECNYRTTADEDRRHGGPLASFAAHIAIPSQSMNARRSLNPTRVPSRSRDIRSAGFPARAKTVTGTPLVDGVYTVYHIAEGLARSATLINDGQTQARLAVLVLGSLLGTSPLQGNNRLIRAMQSIRV